MSLKTKLTSLITTFVLLCSLLTVGVFAVKNTTFNVGGNIEFNVQGIEADIELTANGVQNAVLADNAVAGTDVMNKIEIRNNTSADSIAQQFAKWSNLDMTFAEGQSTATIELKITNRATEEDNYIDITALADATKNNARILVQNNAGGITALLKSGENATFTITFEVFNDEYKASINDFSVNFDMQKKVQADFPVLSADMTYQTLKFGTAWQQNGLSVKDIGADDYDYQSTGDLVIPAYVISNGVIYPVIEIGVEAFGSLGDDAFASITSITLPDTVTGIGSSAFDDCELTRVDLGNGVEFIESDTFAFCANLKSITIPVSFNDACDSPFYASRLTTINYRGTEEEWNAIEGIADAEIPEDCVINYNYKGE